MDGKVCTGCHIWTSLKAFTRQRSHTTGYKARCKVCVNKWKTRCTTPQCATWAVHKFLHCKRHGGGERCTFVNESGPCTSVRRPPFSMCVKHGGKRLCKVIELNKLCKGIISDGQQMCRKHGGVNTCDVFESDGTTKCPRPAVRRQRCSAHLPFNVCSTCKSTYKHRCSNCRIKTIEDRLRELQGHCWDTDKRKGLMDRDLPLQYLLNCYEQQQHCCFYCRVRLDLSRGRQSLDQMTIERIDSTVGHIACNVVLACIMCNQAKSSRRYKEWLSLLQVLKGQQSTVHEDASAIKWHYSHLMSALNSRGNVEKRTTSTVNVNSIREMLEAQSWRCAITGLPLVPTHNFLAPSLDRVDNKIREHSASNCHIVCRFVNMGRAEWSVEDYLSAYLRRGFVPGLSVNTNKRETDTQQRATNKTYIGVTEQHSGRYQAILHAYGKPQFLGTYDNVTVAAWTRDEMARKVMREEGSTYILNRVDRPHGWNFNGQRSVKQ